MLKLIDRYLIASFLLPLMYCMIAFNILFIAYDMSDQLKDFITKLVPAGKIVLYYVYSVPIVVSLTMPFATLLALLYCLGNMSRNNEIIAMRASGIHLFRIIRPYLLMGVVMYAFTLMLAEAFVPQARRLAAEIMPAKAASSGVALAMPSTTQLIGYYNDDENREWLVKSMDPVSNVLYGVTIVEKRSGSGKTRTEAARAEYIEGYGWFFYNVKRIRYARDGQPLPVQTWRKLSASRYKETPRDIASAQRTDAEMMTFAEIGRVMASVSERSDTYRALRMERQKRIAMPATCIVFVLLAAPFGIFHTRAGMVKGVITSIGLCVVYYLVAAWLIGLGAQGHVPPILAAWVPHVLFAGVGYHLLHRMR